MPSLPNSGKEIVNAQDVFLMHIEKVEKMCEKRKLGGSKNLSQSPALLPVLDSRQVFNESTEPPGAVIQDTSTQTPSRKSEFELDLEAFLERHPFDFSASQCEIVIELLKKGSLIEIGNILYSHLFPITNVFTGKIVGMIMLFEDIILLCTEGTIKALVKECLEVFFREKLEPFYTALKDLFDLDKESFPSTPPRVSKDAQKLLTFFKEHNVLLAEFFSRNSLNLVLLAEIIPSDLSVSEIPLLNYILEKDDRLFELVNVDNRIHVSFLPPDYNSSQCPDAFELVLWRLRKALNQLVKDIDGYKILDCANGSLDLTEHLNRFSLFCMSLKSLKWRNVNYRINGDKYHIRFNGVCYKLQFTFMNGRLIVRCNCDELSEVDAILGKQPPQEAKKGKKA